MNSRPTLFSGREPSALLSLRIAARSADVALDERLVEEFRTDVLRLLGPPGIGGSSSNPPRTH